MLVSEWVMRKDLQALGFRFDGDELDCVTAEAFGIISEEFHKEEVRQSKRRGK
jgi:hypothetical protein